MSTTFSSHFQHFPALPGKNDDQDGRIGSSHLENCHQIGGLLLSGFIKNLKKKMFFFVSLFPSTQRNGLRTAKLPLGFPGFQTESSMLQLGKVCSSEK